MPAKRWFLWLLFLLLAAVLAAAEASGWFFLRAPIEATLASRLGREARITAPFRLHFRRTIRLELGGLWIAAPSGFAVPHLVDAQGMALSLRYRDLIALHRPKAPLRFAALDVERMDAQLIHLPDGRATWQFAVESERPPPIVEHLGMREGEIVLRDPFLAADGHARVTTLKADKSPLTTAEISGMFRKRPLQARIELPGGLRLARVSSAAPLAAKGKLDYGGLHLDFAGTFAAFDDLRGAVTMRGPSLSVLGRLLDAALPTTGPFRLQADIVKDSPIWQVAVSEAHIGTSDLAGHFAYDPRPAPPRLDGELTGRNFVLADLAPAFGTRDTDGRIVQPASGRTLPDRPLDLPSLTRTDAHVAVKLDRVDLGSAFSQPIAPLRASLTLDAGRLTLADIDARTAQGRLAGVIAIDATQARPMWRGNLGWDDIRLDTWLKSAKSQAGDIRRQRKTTPPPPWFTGTLHGRTEFVGHGHSTAELLGSLDGRTTVFVRDGTLSHLALEVLGLDIAQGLGLLLRGDDRQPVQCAIIDMEVRSGQMSPRVALVATPVTIVAVNGNIDLAQEHLDLWLTPKPQNVSPLTLRSRFHVLGSFAAPQVTPAAGPIAARAAGALGLALINPLVAILPFVDPGERDTAACAEALARLRQ